ncbi:MAG: HAD family hydrolase [Candidatus Bathyarchaeia archaeon]
MPVTVILLCSRFVILNAGKSSIKAVTFDLWETLLFERDGANSKRTAARCRNLVQALNKLGMEVSPKQVASAMNETASALMRVWKTNKDLTHLDQVRLVLKYALKGAVAINDEWMGELSSAYVSPIFEVRPYLNPDAPEVLRQFKDQNNLVGLICNTGLTPGTAIRRFLEEEGVAKYFDLMFFSDELRIRKPDPRIFRLVSRKFKVSPHNIAHIGDNLRVDVWGAKNAGFKAIYFSSEVGRDKIAESDPKSLVSFSRRLGNLKEDRIIADRTITSLAMAPRTVQELETQ